MTITLEQWVKALPGMRKVGCLNPSCDRPKSFKQVVTAPLLNVRQMRGSSVIRDDLYKRISRLTVCVARYNKEPALLNDRDHGCRV